MGSLQGRPGRAPARPLRGPQLPQAAPGREHETDFITGQANAKRYNRQLRDLIHELPLKEAPEANEKFDKRVEGDTKVVLHPSTEVPRLPDEATAARGS
jgi:glutathione-independent formaldehyde dehydrogenase